MADKWTLLLVMVALCSVSLIDGQRRKIVCYFTNWAQFRPGVGRFVPADIDASLCTHLIYAFADIGNDNTIIQRELQPMYEAFQATKQRNPGLKTLLAIGGWTAGVQQFQTVARSADRTAAFARNAIQYLRSFGFDGLDIDWEYPVTQSRGGDLRDRIDFTNFIRAMYQAFQAETLVGGQERLLLSAAFFVFPTDLYELNAVGNYLDFVNILSYDIEGSWDPVTGMNAPLPDVVASVREFIDGGLPPSKLVLGLATYGRSFRLADPRRTTPGSPAVGPGTPGQFTREGGFLAYYEICTNIRQSGWRRAWWPSTSTPYAYSGSQYVGYDDTESLAFKVSLIENFNLGGAMVWALDLDDFGNQCGGGRYPLLTAVNTMLAGNFTFPTTTMDPGSTISTMSTTTGTIPTNPPGACDYDVFCTNRQSGDFRDPCGCTRYVTCVNGLVLGVRSCPAGLVFNDITKRCDWIYNVPECDVQQSTPRTSPSTQPTTPTTPRTVPTTQPTQPTTVPGGGSVLDRFCVFRRPGIYTNPRSCNSFLVCGVGLTDAVLQPCPNGLAFNGRVCDFPENVPGCGQAPVVAACPTSVTVLLIPDERNCADFYICSFGSRFPRTCPPGTLFNIPTRTCDSFFAVNCSGRNLPF